MNHPISIATRTPMWIVRVALLLALVSTALLASAVSAQAAPDDVSLAPKTSTNPINTNHTVTATVTDGGTPVPGRAGRVRDKGRQRHL